MRCVERGGEGWNICVMLLDPSTYRKPVLRILAFPTCYKMPALDLYTPLTALAKRSRSSSTSRPARRPLTTSFVPSSRVVTLLSRPLSSPNALTTAAKGSPILVSISTSVLSTATPRPVVHDALMDDHVFSISSVFVSSMLLSVRAVVRQEGGRGLQLPRILVTRVRIIWWPGRHLRHTRGTSGRNKKLVKIDRIIPRVKMFTMLPATPLRTVSNIFLKNTCKLRVPHLGSFVFLSYTLLWLH